VNRVATSLLGVVFIAGVLYRPPGPAPPGRTTASRAMAAGTGRLAGSGAGISQSGSSSATPDCRDTDGPWTAIGQALESKESAGPSFSATWSTYKFSGPVRTLIITVPDPVHTRLALHFDRAVASIVQAASDGHYDLDRFWLPWKDTPAPAEPNPDASSGSTRRVRRWRPVVTARSEADAPVRSRLERSAGGDSPAAEVPIAEPH
jgi:hypothetical protein